MSGHSTAPETAKRFEEDNSVSVTQLFWFATGVVGLVLLGVLISALAFKFFVKQTPMGPNASPFQDTRELPSGVRLQTAAPTDLKQYHEQQDQILKSYGWVDQKNGVARIPIDRAMDLTLQKGYPMRGSAPVTGNGITPGDTARPGSPMIAPMPLDGEEVR